MISQYLYENPEFSAVLLVFVFVGIFLCVAVLIFYVSSFCKRQRARQQKKIQENLRRLVDQDREETEAMVATIKEIQANSDK